MAAATISRYPHQGKPTGVLGVVGWIGTVVGVVVGKVLGVVSCVVSGIVVGGVGAVDGVVSWVGFGATTTCFFVTVTGTMLL